MGDKLPPDGKTSKSTENPRAGVDRPARVAAAQERQARSALNKAEHMLARAGWEEPPPKVEDYADDVEFRRARGAWAARGLAHAAQYAEDERNQIGARKAMAELDDKYIMHTERLAKGPDIQVTTNVVGLADSDLRLLEAIGLAFDSPADRAKLSAAIAGALGASADSDRPGGVRGEQGALPAKPLAKGRPSE